MAPNSESARGEEKSSKQMIMNSSGQSNKGSSGGGNKKRKSGKHQTKKEVIGGHNNYRNLDEWLESSVKGIHLAATDQDSPLSNNYSNVNSNPFAFNPIRRSNTDSAPWMMPPELVLKNN